MSSARRKRKSCGGSGYPEHQIAEVRTLLSAAQEAAQSGPPQKEEQTMSLKDFPDKKLLSELEVLRKIHRALREQKPFSLVRIGDGENIVLAQGKFLSNEELEQTYWVRDSRTGRRSRPPQPHPSRPDVEGDQSGRCCRYLSTAERWKSPHQPDLNGPSPIESSIITTYSPRTLLCLL